MNDIVTTLLACAAADFLSDYYAFMDADRSFDGGELSGQFEDDYEPLVSAATEVLFSEFGFDAPIHIDELA